MNNNSQLLPYNIKDIEYTEDVEKRIVKAVSVNSLKSNRFKIMPFYKDINRLL